MLPGLAHEACGVHLPASDRAAPHLLDVLLASPDQAQQHARQALSACPGLAIWCLARARQAQVCIYSHTELASWLAREAVGLLAWGESGTEESPINSSCTPEARAGFARLAARALHAAARFEDRASSLSPAEADTGRLLALVHIAPEWLQTAGLGDVGAWQNWLVRRVAERLASLHVADDAVAESVRWSTDLGPLTPAQAEALAYAWLEGDATAVRLLPRIAARLRRLAELEGRLEQLVEQEKLASLAEFAAGAGHEINNPLAVISGRAQLALRSETNPERRHELALIHAQALRIHEMIADLMLFARPPQPVVAACDVGELLARVQRELAATASSRGATLEVRGTEELQVHTDGVQLSVAVRAVVENALRDVPEGGRVEVKAELVERRGAEETAPPMGEWLPAAGTWLLITIADNGPGLPPEVRRHAFDPFFSGRAAGRGLGMGLAKCWRIARQLGGQVQISPRVGGGTLVTLWLPAEREQ